MTMVAIVATFIISRISVGTNVVYEKAIENDIDFSVDCKDNLSFVAGDDLAVLIGNLADNAVEALAKEQNKKLKISKFWI